MIQKANQESSNADLDAYLRLFKPYEQQLTDFNGREGEYGGRFALLFRQVLRKLVLPSELNERMPRPLTEVAHRYLLNDDDTVRHFAYEENRHFFLSDLMSWLKIQERGEIMKSTERE